MSKQKGEEATANPSWRRMAAMYIGPSLTGTNMPRRKVDEATQVMACKQLANMLGADVLHESYEAEYGEDDGSTPAFQELLDQVSQGTTDFVIAYSPDRLFFGGDRDLALTTALSTPVWKNPGRLPTRIVLVVEDAPFLIF